MPKILTPISLWKNFVADLEPLPVTLGEKTDDGIKFEYVNFSGRDTGMGRVTIYGVVASAKAAPSQGCVLILPDSNSTVDEDILKLFVKNGYAALMIDYRGKSSDCERYTVYPDNVSYANVATCGRYKDYVDESADKTSWYEWVAVGIYARKYISEKFKTQSIGVVGIRDGGEIAWKLAYAANFLCAITVSACGWKAYKGFNKFGTAEPAFDDERYRYIAGIDSQAYAPYIKCPMLMLCPTNDDSYDYDRAYDTFSRINAEYAKNSVIAYSVKSRSSLDVNSTMDMFMFLNTHVKQRHVFIPKPVEITVTVDDDDNLVARANFDNLGIVKKMGVYKAEDCLVSSLRDWSECSLKRNLGVKDKEYYLNVYEKTSILFVLCYVTYSNDFTVWSKIAVKKLSGKFRNSSAKCNVLYSSKYGADGFSIADNKGHSEGGIFCTQDVSPEIVEKEALKGIYSVCGLATYRLNSPQYAPSKDSILRFDVCSDNNITLELTVKGATPNEVYTVRQNIVGGVWQSLIFRSKLFKNSNGVSMQSFTQGLLLSIDGDGKYAINNLIWL